jgi:glycosyltransferase involved in cell wall biosynthesis
LTVEPGVGYRGVNPAIRFKSYESEYLRNFVAGSQNPFESIDGNWYDRTIPNYFEARDFPFNPDKEDFFLYVGRLIQRKGIWIAERTVNTIGARLLVAGQGEYTPSSSNIEFVGYIGPEERADLMGRAKGLFTPTVYMGNFEGVHAEAMLCGTPVITTNFGVFPGTVLNGVNGYRCDTLDDFVWAARNVGKLKPHVVCRSAKRFLTEKVKWEYQKWFDDLYDLYESAVDQVNGVEHPRSGWGRIRAKDPGWRTKITWPT